MKEKNRKPKEHAVDWKKSVEAHFELCKIARRKATGANHNRALRYGARMAGKIVVVPKKIGESV